MSALRDLRGSRPNSAAVAAQIEGFDADFLDARPLHDVPEGGSDDDSSDCGGTSRGGGGAGPAAEELLARAQAERRRLLDESGALQRRARAALDERAKGRAAAARDAHLEGAEARYRGALKHWSDLHEERRRTEAHYGSTVFDMKVKLEARIRRAEEIAGALSDFKRQVALGSRFSRSGRPLGDAALAALEDKERVAEEAVQRARLKNVHLANSLKKLEAQIRGREQLAEGLALIDFEQLKIENQGLAEKVEERGEELARLRRKNTHMVQVLTHMKEKVAFVEQANASSAAALAALEAELSGRRGGVAALKARRDGMRAAGERMKGACLYVTSPLLLADLEVRRTAAR
ncbi:MAG: hypothetical protein J3K34DRAFT_428922 [Monoraphidium minutum]|nr:MAG: hypothetical protein J3K34DRAFT_428922 [Monoraphidium minutum]